MQSFKQFLKEETGSFVVTYHCNLKSTDFGQLPESAKDEIVDVIEKANFPYINNTFLKVALGSEQMINYDTITITIFLKDGHYDFAKMSQIDSEISKLLTDKIGIKFSELKEPYTPRFNIFGDMPSNPRITVEGKLVAFQKLQGLSEMTSLKNVDKVVKSAERMMFNEKLARDMSTVLGLLKINRLKSLWVSSGDDCEWLKIVNKHLKDRDILACQDELIDAGLRAQAKI